MSILTDKVASLDRSSDPFGSKIIDAIKNRPTSEINHAKSMLTAVYERGGKIYIIGNGGSWSMAGHFSSDFNNTVRNYEMAVGKKRVETGFNSFRLPPTTEELTAVANDSSYEEVFFRSLTSHLREPDLVIAISSSGKSPNIIKAVRYAKEMRVPVIGLSGFDGGELNELADAKIHIKTEGGEYFIVEPLHSVVLHELADYFKGYFDSLVRRNSSS